MKKLSCFLATPRYKFDKLVAAVFSVIQRRQSKRRESTRMLRSPIVYPSSTEMLSFFTNCGRGDFGKSFEVTYQEECMAATPSSREGSGNIIKLWRKGNTSHS